MAASTAARVLGVVLVLAGVDDAAQGQQAVQGGLGDHAGGDIGRAGLQVALQGRY
jgi:hypothetical protein